jgi:hypothetical protein
MSWIEDARAVKVMRRARMIAGKPGLITIKSYIPWMATAEKKRPRV